MELPKAFQEKMKNLLGNDYDNYLLSFSEKYGQTLRINQLKAKPAEVFRRFICDGDRKKEEGSDFAPVPWCENGFYYKGEERLSMHPAYYGGAYYLQEPSAMAPAAFLPVEPGEKVLDLCAAPGGKTTALAGKMNGEGVLVANDISISRCRALLKNVELSGAKNVVITCAEPEKLAVCFSEYFDKILIDAPCSGEGMFRKEPSMAKNWSPEEVEKYSIIQKNILSQAVKMLKPGGCLLYSTCTYSPEENEQVVETLLESGEYKLLPLPEYEGVAKGCPEWSKTGEKSLENCRRFWNHRVKGEGQFAALIKKMPGEQRKKATSKPVKTKLPEELKEFLRHIKADFPQERIVMIKERAFLVPEGLPELKGLRIVSSGLHLGDCKKNRFEPGAALALALKPEEYDNVISLELSDVRVDKYLRCETVFAKAKDGWALICADEFPLGWGKVKNETVKNKYPAGWRKG
ncbi:MAG: RsmF rRNA methyltransferase first C-terminal domain-containing protein [Eubacterium sp.]|nr:RsmF rRNA methyltransferase first C-terminal domain-containing protein [Eubacterium sp.]